MTKISRLITGISLILVLLISIFVPATPVLGNSTEEATIGDVTDPGMLPDSGFYFMKNWGRSLQLMFASSDAERAELRLRYANEDALAIKKLCDTGKCEIAARHAEQYELQLQNAIQNAEQARLQQGDKSTEGLVSKLEQNYLRQQEVLASVLEQAPESAQNGILNAIENSNRHIENMILAQEGQAALEQYQHEGGGQQSSNQGPNNPDMNDHGNKQQGK